MNRLILSLLVPLVSTAVTVGQDISKTEKQLDSLERPKGGVPYFFFDDFSDNRNGWPLYSTADHEMTIISGKLRIKGISAKLNYRAWRILEKLDLTKDFSCSVSMTWVEGVNSNGFGLEYCSNNSSDSYNLFIISGSGHYEILKFRNKWITPKPWTLSSFINQGNVSNVLLIEKRGDYLQFSINEHWVDKFPVDLDYGSMFGVRVLSNQTVEFDNFELQGTAK